MGQVVAAGRRESMPFNTPFETGLRALALLVAGYPSGFDLQRLVIFDHLCVHTGDIGEPDSLHAPVPMRSAELLVRRQLVERGLLLMIGKGLIQRSAENAGIMYRAGDFAETFLASLSSSYVTALRNRSQWVVNSFAAMTDAEIRQRTGTFLERWEEQFQVAHRSLSEGL